MNFKDRMNGKHALRDDSLRKFIIAMYQQAVNDSEAPVELKLSLRASERVPKFLMNLEKECALLPNKHQTKEKIGYLISQMTKVFLKNIQAQADQMMLSDAEKSRIRTEHDNAQILDKAATTGVIDEEVIHVLNEQS